MFQIIRFVISAILSNFIGKNPLPTSLKAQVKMSAFFSAIKGKIGGTVFQGSQGSSIVRNNKFYNNKASKNTFTSRSMQITWSGCLAESLNITGQLMPDGSYIPADNTINAQQNIRSVSKAWQVLLPEDRAAWQGLTASYTGKKVFGSPKKITAYELYLKINIALINAGFSPVARPQCHWETIWLEGSTPETPIIVECWVCGSESIFCVGSDPEAGDPCERMNIFFNPPNTNGALILYSSTPMSSGRAKSGPLKILAVIKKASDYNSFIIGPLFNKFFGSNTLNTTNNINSVLINSSGAIVAVKETPVYNNTSTNKIKFTLRANTFTWLVTEDTIEFGDHATGSNTTKTILVYGIQLAPNTTYTIIKTESGFTPQFFFLYGNPSDPLDTDTLKTDQYGCILPIPLTVRFHPTSAGAKDAYITIANAASGETCRINLTGTGI